MDPTPAIPMLMQYGALGILAIGFIVLLVLYVRADKRNQQYADHLEETTFDRGELIKVVVENTRTNSVLASQISELLKRIDR